MVTPLLLAQGVAKTFPNGTIALHGVDLALRAGRVHGLLGANGAGKSTLVKILSGALPASGGTVTWRGASARWTGPARARAAGIATIYQHVPLVPTLSVLENILLDRGGWRRDRRDQRAEVAALLARVGHELDLDALVGDLPIGARQMVAIVQALASGADLIVMDEPTASLAGHERETVYRIVRMLAHAEQRAILFISHFLDEIVSLTDEVTVLRDGRVALNAETATLDEAAIAAAIAGRSVTALSRTADRWIGAPALVATGLSVPGRLGATDITVAAGEIVGIAGLLGSGRSELLHAIFGAHPVQTGNVQLHGQPVGPSPEEAVAAGIALVPEDRAAQGYIPQFEIWKNIGLPHVGAGSWLLDPAAERGAADAAIARLAIRTPDADTIVTDLSGGNAQKVVIAKWLGERTRLLLLDEPTAGIDIGARTDILQLIQSFADDGLPVLLVSSEFSELIAICDRILVMRDGRIVAERRAGDIDEQGLILLAGGTLPTVEQAA
ncbi:sugar ABC transporter ATP-binding protein [Sphingomonas montana]|uniref:sugar ABC transporter ATP-binding protein n=1 Tax=Sphingomonas montana TaxID=1843236 RepID=UPI00096F9E3E|nr:sugar ABC transporter ATP-binding protein [Sphingomonas montana]